MTDASARPPHATPHTVDSLPDIGRSGRLPYLLVLLLLVAVPGKRCCAQRTFRAPINAGSAMLLRQADGLPSKAVLELPVGASGQVAGKTGFVALIELSQHFGVNYVEAEVSLQSVVGAWTAEKNLTVRIMPTERHLSAPSAIAAEFPVKLEQGKTSASARHWFPKWTVGSTFRIDVLEDGVPLEGYSGETGNTFRAFAVEAPSLMLFNDLVLNVLTVDTNHKALFADSQMQTLQLFSSIVSKAKLDELPGDWRGLREIDCIVISRRRLERAASNATTAEKEAVAALRDWALMGGTLLILGSDQADEVGELLNVTMLSSDDATEQFRGQVNLMLYEISQTIRKTARSLELITQGKGAPVVGTANTMGTVKNEAAGAAPNGAPNFVYEAAFDGTPETIQRTRQWLESYEDELAALTQAWNRAKIREVGMGNVILTPSESIDTTRSMKLMTNLLSFQISPMLKRGVDPIMGDGRFRLWLIPGVAEPPVYTFMGILTLFVLLVGPLAYRWTMRGHRSHLMFLIAPALAVVTTVAMFSYSIISDGFGTKVRVRQLTWVDGASGDAVERTRSTLFAGISPREGIRFDSSAEVIPYPNGGQEHWGELRSDVREVRLSARLDEESQRFGPNSLPSRTQTQFVSHRIRRAMGAIQLTPPPPFNSSDPTSITEEVQVTNGLPVNLASVLVRSDDGRYWSTQHLDAGQTGAAKWINDSQTSSKLLGKLYSDFRPSGGVGRASRSANRQEIRDLQNWVNRQIVGGSGASVDGLFEGWLNQNLFVKGDIPPGTFIGLSRPTDDVIAVDDAEQFESVRYVMGTLR